MISLGNLSSLETYLRTTFLIYFHLINIVMSTPPLPLLDYQRYGRQMILNDFGLAGQLGPLPILLCQPYLDKSE